MAYAVQQVVEATLDAADKATGALSSTYQSEDRRGELFFILRSTAFVGTIAVQMSIDNEVTWDTIDTYTAAAADKIEALCAGAVYRIYCVARSSGSMKAILFK